VKEGLIESTKGEGTESSSVLKKKKRGLEERDPIQQKPPSVQCGLPQKPQKKRRGKAERKKKTREKRISKRNKEVVETARFYYERGGEGGWEKNWRT